MYWINRDNYTAVSKKKWTKILYLQVRQILTDFQNSFIAEKVVKISTETCATSFTTP